MGFDSKVVLVTGGTSGIGKETALRFARAGAKVVVAGRRSEEGNAIAKAITSHGGESGFVRTDVTQQEQVKRLVDETVRRFGRLDIAFNNAGVESLGTLPEFAEPDYRKVFDVNVLGVFLSMQYEVPAMLASGDGSIINTSSVFSRHCQWNACYLSPPTSIGHWSHALKTSRARFSRMSRKSEKRVRSFCRRWKSQETSCVRYSTSRSVGGRWDSQSVGWGYNAASQILSPTPPA